MSVNKVIILGRLGQNPELRYTPSGSAVCQFSVATSESWKDKNSGSKQEKTEWHRVIVWGKIGELCNQYLTKGKQVYLEGRLQTRSWDDKSGAKRYTTEIVANTVQFLGGPQDSGTASFNKKSESNPFDQSSDHSMGSMPDMSPENDFTADDIPF